MPVLTDQPLPMEVPIGPENDQDNSYQKTGLSQYSGIAGQNRQ